VLPFQDSASGTAESLPALVKAPTAIHVVDELQEMLVRETENPLAPLAGTGSSDADQVAPFQFSDKGAMWSELFRTSPTAMQEVTEAHDTLASLPQAAPDGRGASCTAFAAARACGRAAGVASEARLVVTRVAGSPDVCAPGFPTPAVLDASENSSPGNSRNDNGAAAEAWADQAQADNATRTMLATTPRVNSLALDKFPALSS